VLDDELPTETVQRTRGCTPKELEKDILQETSTTVAQHENLAAKGTLVLECLCDFSSHFVQTKITPAIVSQINSSIIQKILI